MSRVVRKKRVKKTALGSLLIQLYFRVRYIDTTKVATFITEKIFRYTKVFFV